MLVHSLYEKVANTISQANLSKLSRSQTDWLEEELSRLSAEKQGDIDEIGYDEILKAFNRAKSRCCLLYTSPSPRDGLLSRMPSSA